MQRKPAVAGSFYEADPLILQDWVERLVVKKEKKEKARGFIVPHAGYMYSGKCAGKLYGSVDFTDIKTLIMLGPNHSGWGSKISIWDKGEWLVPNGVLSIDEKLSSELIKSSKLISNDYLSHFREHSLEVQLPFLIFIKPSLKIVPVVFYTDEFREIEEVANAICNVIKGSNDIAILVSSDFTHYESWEKAKVNDEKAFSYIKQIDGKGFYNVVNKYDLTICGFIPITVFLLIAAKLSINNCILIDHTSSGEATGDYDSVVSYASFLFN